MAQNIKFKIKEFQWFQMETKVRQIIQQVLGPLQKRILQNSSVLNRVKYNQTEDQQKIKQITLMIQNDPKVFQTGIFASVDRKFQQQQKKIQQLARQIQQENKYVDQKFKILDIRMQQSSQVLQNVASLRERVSKQIQIQNQNINTVRLNIEQMINDLNNDIRTTRKQQQDNLQMCEKADYKLNQNIVKSQQDIKQMKQMLQYHKQLHKDEACKLEYHSQSLKNNAQQIQILQQSKVLTKKLSDYVKDLQNQLRMAQFKLEAVVPLITEAQISDCLYNVLPLKMKKRIAIHQNKKYSKLNQQVLEKHYKQVEKKFKGLQLLQQMQKRNTKQIVQMKRKKLLAMGIDIDHLTYQQRQRYYKDIVLEDTMDDDDQQVKVTAKVDQNQVLKIVNKHFTDFTNGIKQKINLQLQDSKKYIYDFEQQIRHQVSKFQNKIKQVQNNSQIFQTEQALQSKGLGQQIKQIKKIIESNVEQSQKLYQIMKSYYNFCSLLNHLSIQDQIDKQNISLMGVSENNSEMPLSNKQKNSIIQLDRKCFSCCGYPASTLSAFKMACLAYNPSAISIDSKQYRRQQLLGITTSLLQKIKKNFVNYDKTMVGNFFYDSHGDDQNTPVKMERDDEKIFANQQLKDRIIDLDESISKKPSTGIKFRKTKKTLPNSTTKYSRSTVKNNTSIREDMMLSTNLFSELKKKNLSFLS